MANRNEFSTRVAKLDLDPIKFKLIDAIDGQGWSRAKADQVEIEYRKFLEMCFIYDSEVIVPSKQVDAFWHAHILDTRKYAVDCDFVFGHFLHHFPYLGSRGDADKSALAGQFEKSKELLVLRFGKPDSSSADVYESSVCGGSCGSSCGGRNISSAKHSIDMDSRPIL